MDRKMQLECKIQDYKILKEYPGNSIVTILLLCRGKCREKIYIIKNIKIIEVIPLVFKRSSFYCSVVENARLIHILNASQSDASPSLTWVEISIESNKIMRLSKELPDFSIVHQSTALSWKMSG